MRLAVISSMLTSLKDLIAACDVQGIDEVGGIRVHKLALGEHSLFAACGGMGVVNAALAAQQMIARYRPEGVVGLGVAGALRPGLDIGDVVLARESLYSDFDNRQLVTDYPFMPKPYFAADPALLRRCQGACRGVTGIGNSITGRVISGQGFVDDAALRQRLAREFQADCVDRETAGLAHACRVQATPYVSIRCITDRAGGDGESAVDNFYDFLVQSSRVAAGVLLNMLAAEDARD